MKKILIVKTGALGDVVRTTCILSLFKNYQVYWLTSVVAKPLLPDSIFRIITEEDLGLIKDISFEIILNLEESIDLLSFTSTLESKKVYGLFLNKYGKIDYKDEGGGWFDMSLVSKFPHPNQRKIKNRKTYQEYLFEMCHINFSDEEYCINFPKNKITPTKSIKCVGLEVTAGKVWPMKRWNKYDELKSLLEQKGFCVIIFEKQDSLSDYIDTINSCDLVISGDTLAMHIALALQKKLVSIFICTSPWEIYGYDRMEKVINPLLKDAFYSRDYIEEYVDAISLEQVVQAINKQVKI